MSEMLPYFIFLTISDQHSPWGSPTVPSIPDHIMRCLYFRVLETALSSLGRGLFLREQVRVREVRALLLYLGGRLTFTGEDLQTYKWDFFLSQFQLKIPKLKIVRVNYLSTYTNSKKSNKQLLEIHSKAF